MAQIVTITNPLTGQPAQVDQLEHTAQEIDDAIARALPGGAIDIALQNKLGGVESVDHPGCYYRMVGSVVEWFNPPMQFGGIDEDGNPINEYRTTERYLGKPVYVKVVDCGALTNGKTVSWIKNISDISAIVSVDVASARMTFQHSYVSGPDIVLSGTDAWGSSVTAKIKYTKTTD